MFYYYEMRTGQMVFNDEITDFRKAIFYVGDDSLIIHHLNTIMIHDDFTGHNGEFHSIAKNKKRFFTEYIPRVLGKKSEIKKAKTMEEILKLKKLS
ncbi:MAG: hypothetical protein Q7U35_06790 [Methanobacteriaceae archaeon]|nr:hypothetical protein [Methanobacteriaceae archaeon]MDP2837306.1 hypothetical protein [Methanobacteriaceae archaeon]MDP3034725.1 hypothetical protein [Methanobacteriaceae archaeon]MDP3484188.1 hypothetical protein [Methanobacteriaceae archaeon]MDP3624637.1 hypothetical protein [Methanobacteriaceae archaeon]